MKIIFVGDSTVSKFNDVSYYYSRFGYGELFGKYLNNIEVINYALSGRSSRSFLLEDNYKLAFNSLEKGDYLIIGFGHNDEKDDDVARFSSAKLDINDPLSFKYVLYNNYIKKAIDLGATPILCTPISRLDLSNKYEGNTLHINSNGDYKACILELANELGILGVNLTNPTADLLKALGNDAIIHHAISKGKKVNGAITYDEKSVDKTHLSYYGAYYVAYFLALAIKNSNLDLRNYLVSDIKEPNINNILVNPSYVFKEYNTPLIDKYNPMDNFKALDNNYFGTAFGVLDDKLDKYYAYEKESGVFIVGNDGYGKINSSQEGIAGVFRRIDKKYNFSMSVDCKILSTKDKKQAAFGLMLRNDCYINQENVNENYQTNHITSGLITTDVQSYLIFAKETPTDLNKGNYILDYPKIGDCYTLKISRLGQVITASVIFNGKEYKRDYIDFDILALDKDYLFIGMMSTNGILAEFSNVDFKITGNAKEA